MGKGTAIATLGQPGDVDVASATGGQVLSWDGTNWVAVDAGSGGGGGAVDSVNGQTGAVVIDADDIDDSGRCTSCNCSSAGSADSAVQPSDNVSTLTNDAGYITAADLAEIELNVNDLVTLSGVAENSAISALLLGAPLQTARQSRVLYRIWKLLWNSRLALLPWLLSPLAAPTVI